MAPNAKNLPSLACISVSSTSSRSSSKKLKKLFELNEKIEMILKKIDNLEEILCEQCKNISDHIKNGAWRNRFYKTRLCRFYEIGYCYHGTSCRFAHGPSELRTVDDNLE